MHMLDYGDFMHRTLFFVRGHSDSSPIVKLSLILTPCMPGLDGLFCPYTDKLIGIFLFIRPVLGSCRHMMAKAAGSSTALVQPTFPGLIIRSQCPK